MDRLFGMKMARRMAVAISISFFVIHIAMLALFASCGVVPMVYFNVFSIVFYVCMIAVALKEKLRLFSVIVYFEVVCHMTLAIYFTGWGNGFEVTLIGMSALLFFAEYMGHALEIRYVNALPLCLLGMCVYLGSLVVSTHHVAEYPLPGNVSFWLQIGWAVTTFVISVTVMQIFIMAAFSSEEALTVRLEHDKLTGLPNRYHMSKCLDDIAQAGELGSYWVAMADLDDFKEVNDRYGHNCGDFVLRELADIVRDGLADVEVCRWGGEELLLVGRVGEGMDAQVARLEQLRRAIEGRTLWFGEHKLGMTITIGAAAYREGMTVAEWINEADKRMYEGKANGKNQVVA